MSTSNKATVHEWLHVLSDCMVEFAPTSLGYDDITTKGMHEALPVGLAGAYLALISVDDSVQIGVISSHKGCRRLSGALLCMEPGEEDDLSDADVADAMGEVANILAGMVKSKLSENGSEMNIGLPLFVDGQIEPSCNQEAGAVELQVGEIDTHVVVVRQVKSP